MATGSPTATTNWRKFHAAMTLVWFLAVVPTVLWWSQSVLWVGLMSCYAAAVGHFSAWQAVRSEQAVGNDQEN